MKTPDFYKTKAEEATAKTGVNTTYRLATPHDTRAWSRSSPYTTLYDTKLKVTGRYMRVTRYDKPMSKRWVHRKRTNEPRSHNKECTNPRRDDNKNRAKNTFIDLARTNFKKPNRSGLGTRVIRISYAGQEPTRDQAWEWLQESMLNFQRRLGYQLNYQVVIEYGSKNGRIHMHLLGHNLPYATNEWWQANVFTHGHVKVQTCWDEGSANYLAKYITKDIPQVDANKRSYSTSHRLQKPTDIYEAAHIARILQRALANHYILKESETYNIEHLGNKVTYQTWVPVTKPT